MAKIHSRIAHDSGIPLGGIGTGSIEVRPDGYFHDWQIFNMGRWSPRQPECCDLPAPTPSPRALSFFIRTADGDGAVMARRLGIRCDCNELYSHTWLKSVESIDFVGRFPQAQLQYNDRKMPVSVSAVMFSPIVPHDSRTSGTPGFYAAFRVRNVSDRPQEVSLLATLANPVASGLEQRDLVNTVARKGGATFLTMSSKAKACCAPTLGSLCLASWGGKGSWIAGDFPQYFAGFNDKHSIYGGKAMDSPFLDFRRTGRLPSLPGAVSPQGMVRLSDEEIDAIPPARLKKLVADVMRYPFVQAIVKRVEAVDNAVLKTRKGMCDLLRDVRLRLDSFTGKDRHGQCWGDGALCSSVTLAPKEEREVVFALAWHFPNHFSVKGTVMGHQYENWFSDASDVATFMADNYEGHSRKVAAFTDAMFDTSMEEIFPDAWSGQLTTLIKSAWWTKRGDFAIWEGLGCCGLHTTDITYQGSFPILALFPDLQKRQMEMGVRFQRPEGWVHHMFRPDLSHVDEDGFDRVDMNQQFVLLVCRDWLWTGDRAYLRRLWPAILKAMNSTAGLDGDGDGLPDRDTRRNTYDTWDFRGTPSYIASLWLSALLAAARLADDMGQPRQATKWRKMLAKGTASFQKKLWNGEYYSLWVDGKRRDECCMTDQIDGEWFTSLIGLGHCLPKENILSALEAVMRHNYSDEDGLVNASYPPSTRPMLSTLDNKQALAPWTGIEYAIASMMLDFGMTAQCRRIVANIHDRYMRSGRFWNHVECGDHYYRAMSSWALLLAGSGFKIDLPRQTATFAPVAPGDHFRAPWFASQGFGRFNQDRNGFELLCSSGTLSFRTLRLNAGSKPSVVRLNGRKLAVKYSTDGNLLALTFAKTLFLREGDVLRVS